MPPKTNNSWTEHRMFVMETLKELKEAKGTHTEQINLIAHEVGGFKWKLLIVAILSGGVAGQIPTWAIKLIAYVGQTELYANVISFIGG